MALEQNVARHYGTGSVLSVIDAALKEAGHDPERPDFDALKAIDEFHTAGVEATAAFLDPMGIGAGTRVVDLGAGIGGTARFIAHRYGAHVRGIDLTPEFAAAGQVLTRRLGMQDKVTLVEGSVLDLPFEDGSADLAILIHVGMNIADKPGLFAEAARVLASGGRFAVFDVMRDADGALAFPLPWAEDAGVSHVDAPGAYRRAAHAAGLEEIAERSRRDEALDFFHRRARAAAAGTAPALGNHLIMGATAPQKLGNYLKNVEAGLIAPREMVFRKAA